MSQAQAAVGGQSFGGAPASSFPAGAMPAAPMPSAPSGFAMPPDNGQFHRPQGPIQFQMPQQQQRPEFAAQNPWQQAVQQFPMPGMQQQPAQQFPQQPAAPAGPYQFNDNLSLGGHAGSGFQPQPAAQPNGQQFQPPYGQQPARPVSTQLRDSLIARGMASATQYANDDDLLADLGRISQENATLKPVANLGYQFMAQQQRGGANGQANGNVQQPANGQQQPAPQKDQSPEWREEWSSQVKLDESSGRYVPADAYSNPLLAQKANERREWERNRSRALIENPVGFLENAGLGEKLKSLKEEIRQDVVRDFSAAQRQAESEARAATFLEQNVRTFVAHDQNGQPLIDPMTGNAALTQAGRAAQQYAAQYRGQFRQQYGVDPDPTDVMERIQLQLQRDMAMGVFGNQQPMPSQFAQQPQQQMNGFAAPAPQVGQYPAQFAMQPPMGMTAAAPWRAPAVYAQQPAMFPQPFGQPQFNANEAWKDQSIRQAIATNGARYSPSAAGTIASAAMNAEIPQNPSQSFSQMLRDGAIAKGIVHPSAYS